MTFSFSNLNFEYLIILFATVALIYMLKAFRFYFLLVGERIPLLKYIGVFARTTFANIILPFKIGELYRCYAFGRLTHNYLKGASIVIVDRFIDTASLLCIFTALRFLGLFKFGGIFFLLLTVCFFLVLSYFILPGMISFWNDYFIESASSERHLRELFIVQAVSRIYDEIQNLVKGRFFAVFTLSLLTWLVEVGSLFLCGKYFSFDTGSVLSEYLSAALTGEVFAPQRNFVLASGIFLTAVCVLAAFFQFVEFLRKDRKNER